MPKSIEDIYKALINAPAALARQPGLIPVVPINRSVTPDYVVSLEDGKKFKSMKRHLRNGHGLSPAEYRMKWGLRPDHPIVASNYAKTRSQLAKKMGLGKKVAAPKRPAKPEPRKRRAV